MTTHQSKALLDGNQANQAEAVQKILVVDDSDVILRLVKHALEREGYDVWTAVSGEEALRMVEKHGVPHLAIVDINMPPGMDGFELCRRLHTFCDVPIIMLSAEQEEATVAQGLDRYAEDYIVKPDDGPLRIVELTSRVGRVLRRMGTFGYALSPTINVDARLQVSFAKRHIFVHGREISLTPTETKILYVLMRHAGRTVATDFLLQRVWPL
ncbi:MAG: response regulator transcription factor, partial [Anaerolineales bacterium]|nr:response regulator transcription factor [Anaerolineales bacterium]